MLGITFPSLNLFSPYECPLPHPPPSPAPLLMFLIPCDCLPTARYSPLSLGAGILSTLFQSLIHKRHSENSLMDKCIHDWAQLYFSFLLRILDFFFFFKDGVSRCRSVWSAAHYVPPGYIQLLTFLLPQHSKCWDYRHDPLRPVLGIYLVFYKHAKLVESQTFHYDCGWFVTLAPVLPWFFLSFIIALFLIKVLRKYSLIKALCWI